MTVTPVAYNPAAMTTAGRTLIAIVPAVAKLDAMTIAEANAGTMIHCATEAFGSTTNVSPRTRKMICDVVAVEKPGVRTYQMETLTLMLGDPQTDNDVLDMLTLDANLVFVMRPGLKADKTGIADWAAGQKYVGIKGTVSSVDLRTITTADGDEYAAVINLAVTDRTQLFGEVAAA